jgi:hypothetical protein
VRLLNIKAEQLLFQRFGIVVVKVGFSVSLGYKIEPICRGVLENMWVNALRCPMPAQLFIP